MKYQAEFKLPYEPFKIKVTGKASSKKEFLKNCQKSVTKEHRLLSCKKI